MINVQKFVDDVTAALRSGSTQSDIERDAQKALKALRAGVDDVLVSANCNDRAQIRQHLLDSQAGLKGIDLDGIHVAPVEANAVRSNLDSQITAILLSMSQRKQEPHR